ncbi:MAG TPA: hypothetical protein VGI52_04435 [Solirubrobacteraceae bacterium]
MADTGDNPGGDNVEEPDPRARLMHEVAEQMDSIEADFGDGFQIGRVITIVEITGPDGNVELRVRAGQYLWVSLGMLDFAKKSLEASISGG